MPSSYPRGGAPLIPHFNGEVHTGDCRSPDGGGGYDGGDGGGEGGKGTHAQLHEDTVLVNPPTSFAPGQPSPSFPCPILPQLKNSQAPPVLSNVPSGHVVSPGQLDCPYQYGQLHVDET